MTDQITCGVHKKPDGRWGCLQCDLSWDFPPAQCYRPVQSSDVGRELADELEVTARHARIFITSREKMNPVGVPIYDEIMAKAVAALRAPPASESPVRADRDTWQPIETAPKDGTRIDLYVHWPDSHERSTIRDCRWTGSLWEHNDTKFFADPTHWCFINSLKPPALPVQQVETVWREDLPTTEQLDKLQFGRVLHDRPGLALTVWKNGKREPCAAREFAEQLRVYAEYADKEFGTRSDFTAHLGERLRMAADAIITYLASGKDAGR